MTIQKIAQKQLGTTSTIHFARKGTSDCFWFDLGEVKTYTNTMDIVRRYLNADDLGASDWRVITPAA